MAERKLQYKLGRNAGDASKNRDRRRQEETGLRKQQKDKLLDAKRVRLEVCTDGMEEEYTFTPDDVVKVAKELQKAGTAKLENLRNLRRMFAQGSLLIDSFFSVENSMQNLVGLLSGSNLELQLEAAWALTNMAASSHEHTAKVLMAAAPYFITYLSSPNPKLQDQCAWALGNIAADGAECRGTLVAQGVLLPLVKLLQAPSEAVTQSAAFALSNLCRDPPSLFLLRDLGVLPPLLQRFSPDGASVEVLAEVAWILTFFTASGEFEQELVAAGAIQKLVEAAVAFSAQQPVNPQVVTPVLRCLGNICSGPDELSVAVIQQGDIWGALKAYLGCSYRHVRKECLWFISNLTGVKLVCEGVTASGLHLDIIQLLSAAFDIKMEALVCLCNLAFNCPELREGFSESALPLVVPTLKSHDLDIITLSLQFVDMVLPANKKRGCEIFEQCDGVSCLEGLEYHSNETIQQLACQLLENYFYVEGDDGQEESDKM